MGVKLNRKKPRNILLTVIYRLNSIIPVSAKNKLKLFLDLEWIFNRLSHEISFKLYKDVEHPVYTFSKSFVLNEIESNNRVLDLGCAYGFMSDYIAEKTEKVVGLDNKTLSIDKAKNDFKRNNLIFICDDAHNYLSKSEVKFDTLISNQFTGFTFFIFFF